MTQPIDMDHPDIRAHLAAQDDAPEGFVRMADGSLRPLGGNADNGDGDDE